MIKTVFLIVCLVLAVSGSKRPTLAKIPEVSAAYAKDWYSGYLDFPFQGFTAHMHYFYFPSQTDSPEKDPLLFWFNGGPGCSSLLGALYEHGPFIFNDAFGFLMENKEAWNKRANTVYIESPAQVGFSYMDIPEGSDYPTWNDDMVAELNLLALIEFFNTLPEFYQRPTYIAGESYGGSTCPLWSRKCTTSTSTRNSSTSKASQWATAALTLRSAGSSTTTPTTCTSSLTTSACSVTSSSKKRKTCA